MTNILSFIAVQKLLMLIGGIFPSTTWSSFAKTISCPYYFTKHTGNWTRGRSWSWLSRTHVIVREYRPLRSNTSTAEVQITSWPMS